MFNILVAIALLLLAVATYYYAWRPLPQVSGDLQAPVSGPATITRDALGIPHIQAASVEDAIFLQGFVTAQDRMFQMDGLRRFAAGELSEIIGPGTLETDKESRRLRMRRMAEEHVRTLPEADAKMLAAYARGVNFWIETHRGNLPIEFTLLRYDPRPWSAVDSILAGLQMYRNLTTSWKSEVEKETMLDGGDRAKVLELFPSRTGQEVQPGSNAWAVAGAHTASGKPILANDPHLEFGLASVWYQIHLKAPDLDVEGVSLPGAPAVIVGHNRRIAWGVTNLEFDVQDLYQEKFDVRTGRYEFQGKLEQARLEREVIPVKGQTPVTFDNWVTRHGPVMAIENGRALALRWTAADPGSFQFPFLEINRAGSWDEFTKALSRFPGPGQNFVYADVDGNIGYHATGHLPIRRTYDGDLPVDGSSGQNEWDGYIPFDQLPQSFNPPTGLIVTANQNPFPGEYAYRVSGGFAMPYRSNQIRALLKAKNGWKPEDMLVVQKDVYSSFSQSLAKHVVAAFNAKKDTSQKNAVDLLRNWNGQMEKGTPQPLIAALVFQQLRKAVAGRASPKHAAVYEYQMASPVIDRLLRERPKDWFADWDQVLVKALNDAIEEGRHVNGGNVGSWDYGKYNELTIPNPVVSKIPLVGRYFNIGPIAMSGSPTTVKQTTRRLGPSMRFIADLSNWEQSLNNLTIGESGQILSGHYRDQWDAYYAGKSFPLQFDKVEAKSVLKVSVKP